MIRAAIVVGFIGLLCISNAAEAPPARPRIYGLAFVRVRASDFQKSAPIYNKILGLRSARPHECMNSDAPCFVVNASQHIELTQAQTGDSGSWLDEVGFQTDSVRQMREYLLDQHVQVSEIQVGPRGMPFIECHDPEGNRLAFVQTLSTISVSRPAPEQISSHLFHAGFVVKNLDSMRQFYLDVLGFRLYWKGGFKDLPPGTPEKDSGIDWFEIQVPDGSDWVEFMLNIPANASHEELGVQNHFCLGVPNMAKAIDQLHANGLAPDSRLADDKSEIGRDGKWQFDIFDPDLTRIELMEPAPTQKPCCNPYTAPHPKL